jgi:hypothetical protein
MTAFLAALAYLRFAWRAATNRDRAAILTCVMFSGFTLASLASSDQDVVVKVLWLVAFGVIGWSLVGATVDRAVQAALTQAFLEQARGALHPLSPVTLEFAGMDHVFVDGHGWAKRSEDG